VNTKVFRIVGGPSANPPSTDFLDQEGAILSLAESGSVGSTLNQGEVVCYDLTSLVTNNTTTPAVEQVVAADNVNAGPPAGVYQGVNLSNALTTAAVTQLISFRKVGYGLVYAGGTTTSVKVGNCLGIQPGSYSSCLAIAPTNAITAQGTVFYIGTVVGTGSVTATNGTVLTTGATATVVNAYIDVNR
jgi:hypothetical protein